MRTFIPKIDPNNRNWWVIDVEGKILGRAAVKAATVLRGKHRPTFTPHLDTGDHVIIVNAGKVRVTGTSKPNQMTYYRYSGYPGGLKKTTLAQQLQKKPEDAITMAVRRMMPKNRLGRKMIKKLHVYAGPEHPHQAQQPKEMKL